MGTLYGGSAIIMNKAKDVQLKIIPSKIANDFIKKTHYSGKVAVNSNLHFGAFCFFRISNRCVFFNAC